MYRVLAACLLLPLGLPVAAQPPLGDVYCDETDAIHRKLTAQFGEVRQGLGVHSPESVMELWAHPDTGAWTLVRTYASGRACVVALGDNWADLSAPADPA